ncbi:MAG: hypothetical protein AMJ42_04910 [Deltaproteobacteria bacterium DG_8]|nr:MAG: hypothetical protein AMJ42_04910 [Deltaproteobacteria bacterium DG_8]
MEEDLRYKMQHIGDILISDVESSGVLGFVARVLNEAGGAVVDLYDLGSIAVNKTSSTLENVTFLTKKKAKEDEDQKRSDMLDFITRVLNEAGGAIVDVYDKKMPVLTKKANELFGLNPDVREYEEKIQKLEDRIAELEKKESDSS